MGRVRTKGFTMVELLIVIVIAGLFFAAMVPMFVLASKQGSIDKSRVVAVNVAQSRIEAVRSLPYDSIGATGLAALEGYARTDAQFDPRFDGAWKDTAKPGKAYTVTYTVDEVIPAGMPSDYPHKYKVVKVTVAWSVAGQERHVVLQTAVYRQTNGPQIIGLSVSPLAPGQEHLITSGQMVVTVTLNSLDVAITKYVWITVYANNGSQVATAQLPNSEARDKSRYDWSWDADKSGAPDGPYTFIAVAVADKTGEPGNMVEQQYFLDRQAPQTPVWEPTKCVRGTEALMIVWQPQPAVGDLDHYEVERTGPDGTRMFPTADESTGLPRWSTTLVDGDSLQAGATYAYRVRAWDTSGRSSEWSASLEMATAAPGTTTAPAPPASITAAQIFNTTTNPPSPKCDVRVTWAASPDDAVVSYYFMYRAQADEIVPAGLPYSSPLQVMSVSDHKTSYASDDPTVDWDRYYTYSLTAAGAALQQSEAVAGGPVHVAPPAGTLGFKLYASVPASVRSTYGSGGKWYARFSVVWLETGQVYPVGGITPIKDRVAADDSKSYYTISGLPFGEYQLVATFYFGSTLVGWSSTKELLLTANQPQTIIYTPSP